MSLLTDYDNPKSFGSRLRSKRISHLVRLIENIGNRRGQVSIIDLGGRENYWRLIPEEILTRNKAKITIVNLPKDLKAPSSQESAFDSIFSHVAGDACDLHMYGDNEFDLVHSNSVIEHMGRWKEIRKFASEARRLAPNHFVQTPNFWFPIEPHFLKPFHHWVPVPLRVKITLNFRMGSRRRATNLDEAIQLVEAEPMLLNRPMLRLLFPDSKILTERFCALPKSLIAFRGPVDD